MERRHHVVADRFELPAHADGNHTSQLTHTRFIGSVRFFEGPQRRHVPALTEAHRHNAFTPNAIDSTVLLATCYLSWSTHMPAPDPSVPSPELVLDLLEAFRRSKTMFAAVELGVFDALATGPDTVANLSVRLRSQPMALQTLLESCAALGLLHFDGGLFSNTESATVYLCSQSPRRMTGYIKYSNQVIWQMWAHLEDAIREGTHRWQQTFGLDGPIFSSFFRTPEAMHEFLMGMHGFGMITSPHVVRAFDLSRFKHLCDLGGATGHLPIAACECYPELRATMLDLPHALELAGRIIAASTVADRIEVVGGDFFRDPLPPADLYALGRILHDWDEAKIEHLLRRIYEALPVGGGLLIGEKMVHEDRRGPRWALMQSLNMLICTEGKERSFSEYEKLLHTAGFRQVNSVATDAVDVPLDAILAIKS